LIKEILSKRIDTEELLPELKKYYNGYLFTEDGQERIFNSDMILYYLKEYKKNNCPPRDLIDTNVTSDYTKMAELFTLKNKERNYKILEGILKGQVQQTSITKEFSLAKEFTTEDFLSLLYYLGFLTIDSSILNMVNLRVPNYMVKELYFDFFAKLIKENAEYKLETLEIKKSVLDLALKGDISRFIEIIEQTLNQLANRDFIKFDEKYIKLIMLSYLILSKAYYVKSEYEVEDGYLDIALFKRNGINLNYEAIIELKYIKKKEYQQKGEEIIEEKLKQAKEQLMKYQQAEELQEKTKLKKWAIIFSGDKCLRKVEIN
jgi:hypothetical protein